MRVYGARRAVGPHGKERKAKQRKKKQVKAMQPANNKRCPLVWRRGASDLIFGFFVGSVAQRVRYCALLLLLLLSCISHEGRLLSLLTAPAFLICGVHPFVPVPCCCY